MAIKLNKYHHFVILGSMITEDGSSEKEIKCRIGMEKSKFYDKTQDLHWAVEHYHKEEND